MSRAVIYFSEQPADRWFKGDHRWRAPIRRLIRGPDAVGGIKRVYVNLCKGLDKLGADYVTNIPFPALRRDDLVGVIGLGKECLRGYCNPNRILAGIAVAAHPAEWPTLFEDYPVAAYVVHCEWVKQMYERHYGPRIATWAVGIDTELWRPKSAATKKIDFLIYDKVRWDHERVHRALVDPIIGVLRKKHLTFEFIRYGEHNQAEYQAALARSQSVLFLCEHETQGLAYQEAMSCDIPVLAWNPGQWLDPWRFRYSEGFVPATSVPFFDPRCGMTFACLDEFGEVLERFLDLMRSGVFCPRDYVLDYLTLEETARRYLDMLGRYCA